MLLPKTRQEAIEQNSKYFTGRPCKRGHVSERYKSGQCIECEKTYHQPKITVDKEKKRRVASEWYKKNKISQKNKCAICKSDISTSYHVDHIIPISKGGSNWPKNIQALCPPCNLSKHAKVI